MALTAVPDPTVTAVTNCKRGHAQTDENVVWYPDKVRGIRRPRCRLCRNEVMQRQRDRKAAMDALIVGPTGEVRTIWSQLSMDLRWRVGGLLMSPPEGTDRVVLHVIRRAAERQCWYRSGPDAAARMFVEALLEDTIDARSQSLKIESLLMLVFGPR